MKNRIFLSILIIILISCSSNESDQKILKNIPVLIQNDGTSFTRLFGYEDKKIIKTDRTNIVPYKIGDYADLFRYDSFNRIENFTTFDNTPIIFEIKYENDKITSFKSRHNVDTLRIDLTYDTDKIIEKHYWKFLGSENYEPSSRTVLTFSNGNIIKKVDGDQDGDQQLTEYFYDDKKSPFSNIDDFQNFQLIFTSIEGYWYWISELFLGKNNLIKKEYTWLPTREKTITEYVNIYNTNNYPTNINDMIIEYE